MTPPRPNTGAAIIVLPPPSLPRPAAAHAAPSLQGGGAGAALSGQQRRARSPPAVDGTHTISVPVGGVQILGVVPQSAGERRFQRGCRAATTPRPHWAVSQSLSPFLQRSGAPTQRISIRAGAPTRGGERGCRTRSTTALVPCPGTACNFVCFIYRPYLCQH